MQQTVICIFFYFLGSVFLAHAASHHPQAFLDSIKQSSNEGEQIVQHFCSNCHAVKPLIQLGAPRIQQEADWVPRLQKGGAYLLKRTIEGYNAMPARGGCFECADQQLILALLAMLPKNAQKTLLLELRVHKKNN